MRISDWSSDVCSSDLQTIMLLMTTTDVTSGNTAIVVTTTRLRFFLEQRCVRSAFMQLLVDHLDHKTAARGSRFAFNDCHDAPLPYSALKIGRALWRERVCKPV